MISKRTKKLIKEDILRCRPGDWQHCLRVVGWVKKLGKRRKDLETLIIAAYIHDIGWRDILPSGRKLTLKQIEQYEPVANANSEPFTRDFLRSIKFGSTKTDQILRLIKAADRHQSNSDDEAIIVDADNLSKLSLGHLREKYKKESWGEMLKWWEGEIPGRIKTKEAKKFYPNLLKKIKQYVQSQTS